jgi:hypothetical protein
MMIYMCLTTIDLLHADAIHGKFSALASRIALLAGKNGERRERTTF